MAWPSKVGIAGAVKELGLHESQLYAWRKKARYEASRSETEKALAIENAKLKRQAARARLDQLVSEAFAARKGANRRVGSRKTVDEWRPL